MPRVVLFQPQIPPNTGNVARTCAATGTELHLVEPLGFEINDRQLRRAGLDYWPWVRLHRHRDWTAFLACQQRLGGRLVAMSSHASKPYTEFGFHDSDWLLFGRETEGLPRPQQAAASELLTIPMACAARDSADGGGVRSLNLSVAVGVVLYEALRQAASLGGA
jgi:tRNA (cytidine/uridine-2'-O-)-methyltransferase